MKYLILYPENSTIHSCHLEWYLREVIGKFPGSMLYGPNRPGYELNRPIADVLKESRADFILTAESKYQRGWHSDLQKCNILRAHILGDYVPFKRQIIHWNRVLDKDRYHLVFAQTNFEYEYFKNHGRKEPIEYLPYSVDKYKFIPGFNFPTHIRPIDVSFIGSMNEKAYPNRKKIKELIERKINWKSFTKNVFGLDYSNILRNSKIFVISSSRHRTLTIKYWEAMASGAMVIADKTGDLDTEFFKKLLIPGIHFVIYENLNDLEEKIENYLTYDLKRMSIAMNGQQHCYTFHTNSTRINQMHKIIMEYYYGKN